MRVTRNRAFAALASAGALLAITACSSAPSAEDPFTELPVACDLVSGETMQSVVGQPHGSGKTRTADSDDCSWVNRPEDLPAPPQEGVVPHWRDLHLTVYLFNALEGSDRTGVDQATDVFALERQDDGLVGKGSVDDIGDEAYFDTNGSFGKLKFRQGNIIVDIWFTSTAIGPDGSTAALGNETVREALTKVAKEVSANLHHQAR